MIRIPLSPLLRVSFGTFMILGLSPAHAQTERGGFLGGGSGSLINELQYTTASSGVTNTEYRREGFGLGANIGYFAVKNLAVGLITSYGHSTIRQAVGTTYNTYSNFVSGGPWIRYYYPIKKWSLFGDVSYLWGKQYNELIETTYPGVIISRSPVTSPETTLNLGVGATIFLNSHVGVEAALAFVRYRTKNDIEQPSYLYIARQSTSTLTARIGFMIYFHKQSQESK